MTCTHTDGDYHDCVYVDVRNSRISYAAHAADWAVPVLETKEQRNEWNRRFFEAMDRKLVGL